MKAVDRYQILAIQTVLQYWRDADQGLLAWKTVDLDTDPTVRVDCGAWLPCGLWILAGGICR